MHVFLYRFANEVPWLAVGVGGSVEKFVRKHRGIQAIGVKGFLILSDVIGLIRQGEGHSLGELTTSGALFAVDGWMRLHR
jgi:hypothetical protein